MKRLFTGILTLLIMAGLAIPANQTTRTQLQANKEMAHYIAELLRAEGHPEDHPVILACQEWWRAEDAKEKLSVVFTTQEQRCEYPEAAYVWQLLKEAGLSDIHAAAIVGNAMAESGGHTLAINIYQDTGGYWGAWAMSKYYFPDVAGKGADAQVQKILDTLGDGFYRTTTVREAARWFSDNWERPAAWSEKRADNAEIALEYFS